MSLEKGQNISNARALSACLKPLPAAAGEFSTVSLTFKKLSPFSRLSARRKGSKFYSSRSFTASLTSLNNAGGIRRGNIECTHLHQRKLTLRQIWCVPLKRFLSTLCGGDIVIYCLNCNDANQMFSFARWSLRFMDCYHKGLTGKQAEWANKRYNGHQMLPESIMLEFEAVGIV